MSKAFAPTRVSQSADSKRKDSTTTAYACRDHQEQRGGEAVAGKPLTESRCQSRAGDGRNKKIILDGVTLPGYSSRILHNCIYPP